MLRVPNPWIFKSEVSSYSGAPRFQETAHFGIFDMFDISAIGPIISGMSMQTFHGHYRCFVFILKNLKLKRPTLGRRIHRIHHIKRISQPDLFRLVLILQHASDASRSTTARRHRVPHHRRSHGCHRLGPSVGDLRPGGR